MVKAIAFSGGATQFAGHIAHGTKLIRDYHYEPEVYVGTSAGALACVALALKKFQEAKYEGINLKLRNLFGGILPPVTTSGRIRGYAYLRLALKGAFGNMNGLRRTIKRVISRNDWNEFNKTAKCRIYVGVYNMTEERHELVILNGLSYESMVEFIVASSSIPIYCDDVKIDGSWYCDGGVDTHNSCWRVLDSTIKIDEMISVYSRPKDRPTRFDYSYTTGSTSKKVFKVLDGMQKSISESDEEVEALLAKEKGVTLRQIFAPKVTESWYDVNKERLTKLYDLCYANI